MSKMQKVPLLANLKRCIFSHVFSIGQLRKNLIIKVLYGDSNRVGLDPKRHYGLGTFFCKPMPNFIGVTKKSENGLNLFIYCAL